MKKKVFLLAMMLVVLFAFAPSAWSAGVLNLPPNPVYVYHSGWLQGTMGSTMNVTLSGIVGDYDVENGAYPAWCAENRGGFAGLPGFYPLFDSTGSLPSQLDGGKPWDKINYLLNNKMGAARYDIQDAVWKLLGTDAPSVIDQYVNPAKVDELLNGPIGANTKGAGFDPQPGQIVAVLIFNNGFLDPDPGSRNQDTFFEVVVPPQGCTLTPGYWKTHSINAKPSKYDPTWGGREDDPFYSSGKTWYQVLWTPRVGNAYYILAFQYIAARLNILAGASVTPQVNDALLFAEDFFDAYDPSDTLTKSFKKVVIYNAGVLDSYNNGYIGPGHCSD